MFSSSLAFGGYSASQDVSMEPSPTQTAAGKAKGENILLPVTVHMIDRAMATGRVGDGELRIDGKDVNTILIVGCVEDLNKQQTAMELSINDSTGKIKARYYFSSPEMQKTLEGVENGTYVTVVGLLKMAPAVHVSVLTMRPVQSADEISYHMIEVAHSSLKAKGKIGSSSGAALSKVASSPPRNETPVNSVVTPLRRNEAPMEQAPTMMATPPKNEGPLKDRICKFLEDQKSQPEGVAMDVLRKSFSDSKAEEVKDAMAELLDEGSAYTTIDDEHFACV